MKEDEFSQDGLEQCKECRFKWYCIDEEKISTPDEFGNCVHYSELSDWEMSYNT